MSTPFLLENKIKELESIESEFQQPNMSIDEAIVKHENALKIAKEIKNYLEKAENTLKKIDISALLKESGDEVAEQSEEE